MLSSDLPLEVQKGCITRSFACHYFMFNFRVLVSSYIPGPLQPHRFHYAKIQQKSETRKRQVRSSCPVAGHKDVGEWKYKSIHS
jgi:hypothetical protein